MTGMFWKAAAVAGVLVAGYVVVEHGWGNVNRLLGVALGDRPVYDEAGNRV